EVVFEAATAYENPGLAFNDVLNPDVYAQTRVRLTKDGILPWLRYVVREKGKVEVGSLSCASCHLSVLANATVMRVGQGNFPLDQFIAFRTRHSTLQKSREIF